jgi:hypothetical protein
MKEGLGVLKNLENVSHTIDVEVEEGLFGGLDDPLQALAERLAETILAEPGLPLKAIRVARADLPEEDDEDDQPEISFDLRLACTPKEAFKWLEQLSHRQYEIDQSLPEKERRLFNHTFRIGMKWETRR